MNKTVRKIDLMHRQFGTREGHTCKECSNLDKSFYDTTYYKCIVYGKSRSEATDWRLKWTACGMLNKEWHGGRIVELVSRCGFVKREEAEPLDGQFLMEEM